MSIGSDSWESGHRTRESAWTLLERETRCVYRLRQLGVDTEQENQRGLCWNERHVVSIGSDSWESGHRTRESAWTLLERETRCVYRLRQLGEWTENKRISVDFVGTRDTLLSIGSDSWESGHRTRESAWTLLERETRCVYRLRQLGEWTENKRISVDFVGTRDTLCL